MIGWWLSQITVLLALVACPRGVIVAGEVQSQQPLFSRHVVPILSKLGCNGGTCHGAVQGQQGFRLSMFGADPVGDHQRLVHEFGGRRLDLLSPEASLLLRKATGNVAHGGGRRLQPGSDDYQILRQWIANGALLDDIAQSRLSSLRISPSEFVMEPGHKYSLKVEAEFANGSIEDVTTYCSWESLDGGVATIDTSGAVTAVGSGAARLVARYRAQPVAASVLVPRPRAGDPPDVTPFNFVDVQVLAKLRRLNLSPAQLCDDATFLRRICLDVTGELPAPDEIRTFLADNSPDKRVTKIEDLLSRPGHADLWALIFGDILKAADFGVYADALTKEHDAPRMQAWIRARLAENTPYDEFVERILLATSREGRTMDEYAAEVQSLFEGFAPGRPDLELYSRRRTLDLYWQRRGSDGVKGAMQVAHAFLGLRLECAQCHRHPHDNWQQEDLLDFANFFMRVRPVGFQGDNEKKFADAAVHFQRFNDEAKALEAEVKGRKEGDGKRFDEEAKQSKANADKLTAEIAKLEKAQGDADEIAHKREELAAAKESLAQAETYRQETAALEKRAKLLPEIARRLLQAECRLLPTGKHAQVSSTLGTRESSTFRLLGETEAMTISEERDPREMVVEWMRRPDNPYFAKAIVNRVWAHYFGRGIIDPPDNLSAFNPATHPELLQDLCAGFIANKYDLHWLHRTIVTSRTYQQSTTPAADAESDRTHYAAFPLRRLPAEVLLDALNTATGTAENMDMKYHHWPSTLKTIEAPFVPKNPFVAFVLETYGRPQRNVAVQCDCERDSNGSIFQVLTLANHPRVWEKISDPSGRAAQVLKTATDAANQIEELFLGTVSRLPTDAEQLACRDFLANADTPERGLQNVLWSLINTREFLLQH